MIKNNRLIEMRTGVFCFDTKKSKTSFGVTLIISIIFFIIKAYIKCLIEGVIQRSTLVKTKKLRIKHAHIKIN